MLRTASLRTQHSALSTSLRPCYLSFISGPLLDNQPWQSLRPPLRQSWLCWPPPSHQSSPCLSWSWHPSTLSHSRHLPSWLLLCSRRCTSLLPLREQTSFLSVLRFCSVRELPAPQVLTRAPNIGLH